MPDVYECLSCRQWLYDEFGDDWRRQGQEPTAATVWSRLEATETQASLLICADCFDEINGPPCECFWVFDDAA